MSPPGSWSPPPRTRQQTLKVSAYVLLLFDPDRPLDDDASLLGAFLAVLLGAGFQIGSSFSPSSPAAEVDALIAAELASMRAMSSSLVSFLRSMLSAMLATMLLLWFTMKLGFRVRVQFRLRVELGIFLERKEIFREYLDF